MSDIELLFVEPLNYDVCGLRAVKVDGMEYIVADDDDDAAQAAAIEAARENLWAFSSTYLGQFLGLGESQIKAVRRMQEELCEDAQEIIELLLGDKVEAFLDGAVDIDGRGHFLSCYDGEEQDGEDVSPALEGKLVYRRD